MSFIGESIINVFVWFIWWMLLLPICLFVATPVILFISLKGNGTYREKMSRRYGGVVEFWREHAWMLSP
jgi:hypothetical protein